MVTVLVAFLWYTGSTCQSSATTTNKTDNGTVDKTPVGKLAALKAILHLHSSSTHKLNIKIVA